MIAHWDWICWYMIACLAINLVCTAILDGMPRDPHSFKKFVFSVITATPIYGRVLGWW